MVCGMEAWATESMVECVCCLILVAHIKVSSQFSHLYCCSAFSSLNLISKVKGSRSRSRARPEGCVMCGLLFTAVTAFVFGLMFFYWLVG